MKTYIVSTKTNEIRFKNQLSTSEQERLGNFLPKSWPVVKPIAVLASNKKEATNLIKEFYPKLDIVCTVLSSVHYDCCNCEKLHANANIISVLHKIVKSNKLVSDRISKVNELGIYVCDCACSSFNVGSVIETEKETLYKLASGIGRHNYAPCAIIEVKD